MRTAGIRVPGNRPGDGAEIQRQQSQRLRKPTITPHPAYGDREIPGKIPPGAVIIAEIEFIAERDPGNAHE